MGTQIIFDFFLDTSREHCTGTKSSTMEDTPDCQVPPGEAGDLYWENPGEEARENPGENTGTYRGRTRGKVRGLTGG